jgi:hypothetical protein
MKMAESELDDLKKASDGLLYPSDSDEPFDPFEWKISAPAITAQQVAAQAGKANEKIEEVSLDQFFGELSDSSDAKRFDDLKTAIKSHLSNARVFRVGETEIDIYIVGKTTSDAWIGLHTKSVET